MYGRIINLNAKIILPYIILQKNSADWR